MVFWRKNYLSRCAVSNMRWRIVMRVPEDRLNLILPIFLKHHNFLVIDHALFHKPLCFYRRGLIWERNDISIHEKWNLIILSTLQEWHKPFPFFEKIKKSMLLYDTIREILSNLLNIYVCNFFCVCDYKRKIQHGFLAVCCCVGSFDSGIVHQVSGQGQG